MASSYSAIPEDAALSVPGLKVTVHLSLSVLSSWHEFTEPSTWLLHGNAVSADLSDVNILSSGMSSVYSLYCDCVFIVLYMHYIKQPFVRLRLVNLLFMVTSMCLFLCLVYGFLLFVDAVSFKNLCKCLKM